MAVSDLELSGKSTRSCDCHDHCFVYPQVVRVQLSVPAELLVLCGLAVGYPDPDFPANRLQVSREPIDKNVAFLDR
jgi:hypothetical protein